MIRVSTTAYKDSDGKLVIIVINGENGPRDIDVYLDDHKAETFLQYRTSELENVEQLEDVEVSGNVFSMSLPAKTITT
ncbi:MAG: hypothetical protein GWO08_16345, partial [Gammaproteobacteria bacterium]|nr:hypothetical protein [Gammaproteobacteria bacterium]